MQSCIKKWNVTSLWELVDFLLRVGKAYFCGLFDVLNGPNSYRCLERDNMLLQVPKKSTMYSQVLPGTVQAPQRTWLLLLLGKQATVLSTRSSAMLFLYVVLAEQWCMANFF